CLITSNLQIVRHVQSSAAVHSAGMLLDKTDNASLTIASRFSAVLEEAMMKTWKLVPVLLVALVCATTSTIAAPQAKAPTGSMQHNDAAGMLKQDMRKLWTDHVVWTRDYIVAAVG